MGSVRLSAACGLLGFLGGFRGCGSSCRFQFGGFSLGLGRDAPAEVFSKEDGHGVAVGCKKLESVRLASHTLCVDPRQSCQGLAVLPCVSVLFRGEGEDRAPGMVHCALEPRLGVSAECCVSGGAEGQDGNGVDLGGRPGGRRGRRRLSRPSRGDDRRCLAACGARRPPAQGHGGSDQSPPVWRSL